MSKTIYTGLGAVEYVTVTIPADVDISSATVEVAVGSYDAPGAWLPPDDLTFGPGGTTAAAKLLIGNSGSVNPVAGQYYLWYRVMDTAEIVIAPVRGARFATTDTTASPVQSIPLYVEVTNLPTSVGQILAITSLDPLQAQWQAGEEPSDLALADNGNGTYTLTGSALVDNGDGTLTITSTDLTDNGDGTYTIAA